MMMNVENPGPFVITAAASDSMALTKAVGLATKGLKYAISVLPREHEWELLYQVTNLDSDQILRQFMDGVLVSVRFSNDSDVSSVSLFKPAFSGDRTQLWHLYVEQASGDPLPLFSMLQSTPGFVYVALYLVDNLVEVPEPVTIATFPWESPWLVAAAVLDEKGGVHVRRGEAWSVIYQDPDRT
jgi:hypothetical protein